jgi:hypothetical protein
MIAHVCSLDPKEFVHTFGDLHIYLNHLEHVKEQLLRGPFSLPTSKLNRKLPSIDDFRWEDFEIIGYEHGPTIKLLLWYHKYFDSITCNTVAKIGHSCHCRKGRKWSIGKTTIFFGIYRKK